MLMENSISSAPRMRCTVANWCFMPTTLHWPRVLLLSRPVCRTGGLQKGRCHLKHALDPLDLLLFGDEQNDMIAGFDHCVVVSDEDLIVAQDGTDCGRRHTILAHRQLEFAHSASDHARVALFTVSNGFNGFRRAAAQRVSAFHGAAPHVSE